MRVFVMIVVLWLAFAALFAVWFVTGYYGHDD